MQRRYWQRGSMCRRTRWAAGCSICGSSQNNLSKPNDRVSVAACADRLTGLVFGRTVERPFEPTTLSGRATTAWKRMNHRRASDALQPIAPIGLHECRHTFASLMIAAGVNAKALSTYMGHSSITSTLDRYGHLMPGNEEEAARLLDRYLESSAPRAAIVAR